MLEIKQKDFLWEKGSLKYYTALPDDVLSRLDTNI
jgi:hypothetical protein